MDFLKMSRPAFLRWLGFRGTPAAVGARGKQAGESITRVEGGEIIRCALLKCCHCQFTWEYVAGSGRKRGYCHRCGDFTCGSPACDACIPWERRLENIETGRPELLPSPLLIVVPRGVK